MGLERAPEALLAAGLEDALRAAGHDVVRPGDLPKVTFGADPVHPRAQNLPLVAGVARLTAERVAAALASGALPLIVGGDCSVTIGVVAGALHRWPALGLVYFDGDVDMEVPEETPSGIFDGMVLAHLLGRGAPELCQVGPRVPLLAERDVVLFGYNPGAGYVEANELARLTASKVRHRPISAVRGRAEEAAREALAAFGSGVARIVVHFDVDVVDGEDFPAADLLHAGGLPFEEAFDALRVFVASPRFGGLVVTEFNADRDADGALARRLVVALAECFRDPGWEIRAQGSTSSDAPSASRTPALASRLEAEGQRARALSKAD